MTSPSTVLEIDIRSAVWKGVATLYGYTAKPGISEPATPKGSQHPGTTLPAPSTQDSGFQIRDLGYGFRTRDGDGIWRNRDPRHNNRQRKSSIGLKEVNTLQIPAKACRPRDGILGKRFKGNKERVLEPSQHKCFDQLCQGPF